MQEATEETRQALAATAAQLGETLDRFNAILSALNAGQDVKAGSVADDLLADLDASSRPYTYLKFPNEYPAWEALRDLRAIHTDHCEALAAAENAEDNYRRA